MSAHSMRLLLVDDETGFTDVLAKRLAHRGVAASVAPSGAEGLRLLRENGFDAAVIDLKMPDMNGIEVLKAFKEMMPAMPLVLLTGHGSEEAVREGLMAGASDDLLKPCDIDELLERIEAVLANAASARESQDEVKLFDARATAWDASPRRRKMARDIAAAMDEEGAFAGVGNALDFGCGTGLLTLELAERLPFVTGLDTSPGMLAELSTKITRAGLGNVGTRLADLARGDAVDNTFDLVASAMALHHVADLPAVLRRLFQLTSPGGHLALADLDSEGGAFHDDPSGVHHTGFDREALAATLRKIGWTDLHARTATTIEKPTADGGTRPFTVFLMTGRKPAEDKKNASGGREA